MWSKITNSKLKEVTVQWGEGTDSAREEVVMTVQEAGGADCKRRADCAIVCQNLMKGGQVIAIQ